MKRALLLATIGCALLSPAEASKPKIDIAAPDFTVTLFNKTKVSLADMRGKVVVINYWATWCGPCKAEMPMMDLYHRRNKARGFEIFGVVTRDSLPPSKLKQLASLLSYPLALGLKGKYGVIGEAVPTSYIIDRKGVIRYAKAGSFEEERFKALIDPLLDEAP